MAPSVGSLCHPRFTTTNLSYGFPIVKLPPPPCAVLLASTRKCHVGCHPQRCWRVSLVQSAMGNQLIRTAVSQEEKPGSVLSLHSRIARDPGAIILGLSWVASRMVFIARNTWIDWLCYIQWDIVLFPRAFERRVLQKKELVSYIFRSHVCSSYIFTSHVCSSYIFTSHVCSSYVFTSHVCSSYIFTS